MITGGHNLGRVGLITHRERHHGGFDIVHIKDSLGHQFATRSVIENLVMSLDNSMGVPDPERSVLAGSRSRLDLKIVDLARSR